MSRWSFGEIEQSSSGLLNVKGIIQLIILVFEVIGQCKQVLASLDELGNELARVDLEISELLLPFVQQHDGEFDWSVGVEAWQVKVQWLLTQVNF